MQEMMPQIGRLLIGAGVALVIVGLLFMYAKQLHLGQLPGDITVGGVAGDDPAWHVAAAVGALHDRAKFDIPTPVAKSR